jgi:rhamnosyl/mannosyltransferase
MIRVCHLAKYFAPAKGGIETHVRTIAKGQAAQGAEVHVLCVNHSTVRHNGSSVVRSSSKTVRERDGAVQVVRLGSWASVFHMDFCRGLRRELARLSSLPIDVFHLHVPNPTMMLALASIGSSTPLVITHHSDVVRQRVLYQGLRPFERRVFDRARRVLATSPNYVDGSAVLKRQARKVEVCPFGIDLAPLLRPTVRSLEAERRWRAEYGEPLWLSVGRLVYYKGHSVALEALRHVPGLLVVVGSGPLEKKLHGEAKRLGVEKRVIWKPHVTDEELVGAYRAATALWFPSVVRSEAFGLAQVEAMACGCPVINCDIPHSGVSWVSRHEESGLTVPINNPRAFATAARRLIEEPALREHLAAGAKTRAIDDFDYRRMVNQSLDIYRELLEDAPQVNRRAAA